VRITHPGHSVGGFFCCPKEQSLARTQAQTRAQTAPRGRSAGRPVPGHRPEIGRPGDRRMPGMPPGRGECRESAQRIPAGGGASAGRNTLPSKQLRNHYPIGAGVACTTVPWDGEGHPTQPTGGSPPPACEAARPWAGRSRCAPRAARPLESDTRRIQDATAASAGPRAGSPRRDVAATRGRIPMPQVRGITKRRPAPQYASPPEDSV
jgi:hypothetical protein